LILTLFLSMITVAQTSAIVIMTNLYITPVWSSVGPFSIDIMVENVINLAGYEFKLAFDPAILKVPSVASIVVGDFFPTIYVWKKVIDPAGFVWLGVSRPLGTPPDEMGVSGSGKLATITFQVIGTGACYLDLYDTKLGDPGANPIAHNILHGYFANIPTTFEANLIGKSAWPEHHHFVPTKDEDGAQNLTGKVRNLGNVIVKVKVVFTIYDEDGVEVTPAPETPTVTLQPGETRDLEVEWTGYIVPMKYSVEARVWYDTDGDGVPDALGAKVKPFSFAVA